MKRMVLAAAGMAICLSLLAVYSGQAAAADSRFEISYPAELDNGPITGRIFVVISKPDDTALGHIEAVARP